MNTYDNELLNHIKEEHGGYRLQKYANYFPCKKNIEKVKFNI